MLCLEKGPQSIALWEGSCCVYEKKGRPKADKASEASKPTVIVWEMVMYTVADWGTGEVNKTSWGKGAAVHRIVGRKEEERQQSLVGEGAAARRIVGRRLLCL